MCTSLIHVRFLFCDINSVYRIVFPHVLKQPQMQIFKKSFPNCGQSPTCLTVLIVWHIIILQGEGKTYWFCTFFAQNLNFSLSVCSATSKCDICWKKHAKTSGKWHRTFLDSMYIRCFRCVWKRPEMINVWNVWLPLSSHLIYECVTVAVRVGVWGCGKYQTHYAVVWVSLSHSFEVCTEKRLLSHQTHFRQEPHREIFLCVQGAISELNEFIWALNNTIYWFVNPSSAP